MPVTIRAKPSDRKDAVSTPSATTEKPDLKSSSRVGRGGKTAAAAAARGETSKSPTDRTSKSTDSPRTTSPDSTTSSSTTNTISNARQRARERRRGKPELSPDTDSPSPDPGSASGRIKNLAGFFAAPKEEVTVVSKKRFEVADHADKSSSESESEEDSDEQLDTIKRASEPAAGDKEQIEIEKGSTKSIASLWQNRKDDDSTTTKKKPFKLDIMTEEPTVFENEPESQIEGVVRSDDACREEIVLPRPGRIKDLAVSFANISSQPLNESDEEGATEKHSSVTQAKEDEVFQGGKIKNVRERWKKRQQKSSRGGESDSDADSSDDSSSTEAPAQKSSKSAAKEEIIAQPKMKNLRDKWNRRQNGPEEKGETAPAPRPGPIALRKLDTAKEHGVFENEPIVREGVVRADDEQPDIISSERTKKLRKMWTKMEKETTKPPAEEVVRVTKKKEEKQEPEVPTTTQEHTSKTHKVSGRLSKAQKEAEQAKAKEDEKQDGKQDGKPGKSRSKRASREAEQSKSTTKDKDKDQQQEKGEGKGKLQKTFPAAAAAAAATDESKPAAPKSPSLMRCSTRKKNVPS